MNKNCEVKTKKSGKLAMVLVTIFSAFTLMVMGIWAVANGRGVSFSLPITLDPLTFLTIQMQMDFNGDGDFEDEGEDDIYTIFDNTASGSVSWAYVSEGAISFAKNSPIKNVSNDTIYKLTFMNKSGTGTYLNIFENYDDSFYNKPFTTYPTGGILNLANEKTAEMFVHSNPVLTTGLYPLPLKVETLTAPQSNVFNLELNQTGVTSSTPTNFTISNQTSFQTTFTALDNYALPSQVKITCAGTELEKDIDYKWNQETGELNIFARSITGDIVIRVVGAQLTWDYTATAYNTENSAGETAQNPILIQNAGNLKYLAEQVNGGAKQSGVYFELTTDINLNGSEDNQWTPIGDYGSNTSYYFSGTFDGKGHTIDGLYINKPDNSYQGLFGRVNGGILKNIIIDNSSLIAYQSSAGIVGGASSNTYIDNCTNRASLHGKRYDIGGIIGISGLVTISNCVNYGEIVSDRSSCGGIVGVFHSPSKVINCTNYGNLYSSISFNGNIGGVCGLGYGNGVIINCTNHGHILQKSNPTHNNVGGILGKNGNDSGTTFAKLINCYNVGYLFTYDNFLGLKGSICGRNYYAETEGYLKNCYYLPGTNDYPVENAYHSGCSEITSAQALCDSLNSNIKALAQEYVGVKIYYWTLVGSTNGWPILSDSYELVESST